MLIHTVTPLRQGFVTLHIELQSLDVQPILQAFSAMCDLARSVTTKTKTATSPERIDEQREVNEAYYLEYCNAITHKFDELYLTGLSASDALKETNKQLKLLYPNTCYDSVKQILTVSSRLRNKNYNKRKKA